MADAQELFVEAERLKELGDKDGAIAKFLEVVAADPMHVLSHLTLARLFTQVGKHDEAIAHGQRACELEPEDAFNLTAMSVTYQRAYAGTGERKYIQMAEDAMASAQRAQGRH